MEVKDRGRIPAELVVRFKVATERQDPERRRPLEDAVSLKCMRRERLPRHVD